MTQPVEQKMVAASASKCHSCFDMIYKGYYGEKILKAQMYIKNLDNWNRTVHGEFSPDYIRQNVKFANGEKRCVGYAYYPIGRRLVEGVIFTASYLGVKDIPEYPQNGGQCQLLRDTRNEDEDMLAVLSKTKNLIEGGNIGDAERVLEEALQKSKSRQLTEWTNVFLLLLGKIKLRKKEYDNAEKLYDELVENVHKTLEKTPAIHRLTLWAYIDLAQLYSETNRPQKAEELYKQSLYNLEVMFVDAHDFTWAVETMQQVLDGYAHLLADMGRFKEALEHREHVQNLYTTLYGEKHQKIVYNLNEFGRIYTLMGDNDNAIKYFTEAIQMAKAVQMDPLEVCALYVNNGRVHMRKGIIKKAKEYCSEAMSIAKKMQSPLGQEHAGKCLEEIASIQP